MRGLHISCVHLVSAHSFRGLQSNPLSLSVLTSQSAGLAKPNPLVSALDLERLCSAARSSRPRGLGDPHACSNGYMPVPSPLGRTDEHVSCFSLFTILMFLPKAKTATLTQGVNAITSARFPRERSGSFRQAAFTALEAVTLSWWRIAGSNR